MIEDRLREADKQCYLTWQTEIKEKRFILSYVTENGAVKHATVPNPSARKVYGSLSDASEVLERMILSNDDCLHPVQAPASPCRYDVSDDNNNISLEEDYVVSDLSCYACGHVAEHRRELFQHVRTQRTARTGRRTWTSTSRGRWRREQWMRLWGAASVSQSNRFNLILLLKHCFITKCTGSLRSQG